MSVDSIVSAVQNAAQTSIQVALIKSANEQQAQVMELIGSMTGTVVNTQA